MTDFAVTGASGFVGASLCRRLVKADRSVRACSRNPGSLRISGASMDIREVSRISRAGEWERAFAGVETVVHLAARVHQPEVQAIDAYRSVNVAGTEAVAAGAIRAGVKRLIFISTVKVNGEKTSLERPFHIDDLPRPTDPYAVSKWEAEQRLWDLARRSELQIVVIRPVLVYGPGVRGNFLRMLKLIDKGIPLPLGAIKNKRSVVYVENLCDLIEFCGDNENVPGKVLFAADGNGLSTPDLFRMIAKGLNRRVMLISIPPGALRAVARLIGRDHDLERLCGSLHVDMSSANDIGWSPPVGTEEAVEATTDWFRNVYK